MTSLTNYMTVRKSSYALQTHSTGAIDPDLKERLLTLIYPAMGILGILYQLYLLISQ